MKKQNSAQKFPENETREKVESAKIVAMFSLGYAWTENQLLKVYVWITGQTNYSVEFEMFAKYFPDEYIA